MRLIVVDRVTLDRWKWCVEREGKSCLQVVVTCLVTSLLIAY